MDIAPLRAAGHLLVLALFFACIGLILGAFPQLLGMGGVCATGGPYAVVNECPTWMAGALAGAVPGMIIGFFVLMATTPPGWRFMGWIFWPLIFIGLGAEFLWGAVEFLPRGAAWGFLACALVFLPLGAIPAWTARGALRERRVADAIQIPLAALALVLSLGFALSQSL